LHLMPSPDVWQHLQLIQLVQIATSYLHAAIP
jgi:hypothetical protein